VSISRRDFIGAGAAAAAGVTLPKLAGAMPVITVRERSEPVVGAFAGRPVIVSAANGFDKDPGGKQGIRVAYEMLTRGSDPLDAIVAGVQVVELNPNDQSVGLAGLPNEEGVVQLDASCMHGPTKRAGSVGCLEDVAEAAAVAKAIMDHTDHIMLVGAGAKKFAIEMGFKTQNLLTEQSRRDWLRWKAKLNPSDNWLDPVDPPPGPTAPGGAKRPSPEDQYSGVHVYRDSSGVAHTYGTINMNAVTATGDIASVTTTSGLSWKIPGRLGDSPILGAGLYVDGDVGAAGSTGRGEANLYNLSSYLIVEELRRGKNPKDAGLEACRRIKASTVEKRLLNSRGEPNFNVNFYVLNKRGEYAGVGLYAPNASSQFAVCDDKGPRLERIEALLPGSPTD